MVTAGEKRHRTYALLDDGSTKSIISERLVKKMGIKTTEKDITIHTVNGITQGKEPMADFKITSLDENTTLEIQEALVSDSLTAGDDQPPTNKEIAHLKHMEGVTLEELESNEIDVLLSVEFSFTWLGGELRRSTYGKVIGLKTKFGWTLAGGKGKRERDSCLRTAIEVDNKEINDLLQSIFKRDFPPIPQSETHNSIEDEHAIRQMRETIRLDKELGHYRVGIPWKTSREEAAAALNAIDSSGHAKKRLIKSIEKIKKNEPNDPPIATELKYVKKQLGSIFENKRAEFINPEDVPAGVPSYVLPLHIVYEPNKPTKPRCCHDGASKLGGTCLNDHILTGPDLLNSLLGIIFRFRENKVTLSADIKGFFHQVYVDERDTYVFQFWWFSDEECNNPQLSLIKVHIFGAKSSPTVCTFALRHHGKMMEESISPEAALAIIKSFYVDDLLVSYKDIETAKRVKKELTETLAKGGFELLKWNSSHKEVLDEEEEETEIKDIEEKEDAATMDKVLGVRCSFKTDEFCFYVKPEKVEKTIKTKRELLRTIARCFDPIGIIAPFMLLGKLSLQTATSDKTLGRDDQLLDQLQKEVEKWRTQITALSRLRIPRWFQSEETEGQPTQLHIFTDSSSYGYGYVAYIRSKTEIRVDVRFVFGKARVIPKGERDAEITRHHSSIPRFELTAAAAASDFYEKFKKEITELPERTFFWSDSECVLKQIKDRRTRHETFVKNRLSRIRTHTSTGDWHYVNTKANPADLVSRGIKGDDEEAWDTYLKGPEFLRDIHWEEPEKTIEAVIAATWEEEEEEEKEPEKRSFLLETIARKSRWTDKIRIWARVKRCGRKWTTKSSAGKEGEIPKLTNEELTTAKKDILKEIQKKHYEKEAQFLTEKGIKTAETRSKDRLTRSSLKKVNPFIDEEGLIRSSTRLINAENLVYNTKCPIILPKNEEAVESLIRDCHEKHGHAGTDYIRNMLRREFMIIADGQAVRRVVKRCITCQKWFKETTEQQMGPLPTDRVTPGGAFEVTGCDLFGPYELKCGRKVAAKRWVAIFTCFKIRAVHFEIVETLSSPSLLNAIIRFRSRFPGVRKIVSDAGTNFVGAEKLLKTALEKQKGKNGETLDLPIEWQRITAKAAFRAGVWERLIKSTKRILATLLGKEDATLETFRTILHQAEFIMNHRPITHVSNDPKDMTALTPACFIHGASTPNITNQCDALGPIQLEDMRFAHNRSLAMSNALWKRWINEYITTLRTRSKWFNTVENIKKDQMVVLVDETKIRKDWKLGRVTAVRGENGLVRTVKVRTGNGRELERDVTKIVPLEMDA